ncbi:hypothetical protein, conserved [Eimeria tenella]|uniref:Inositol monophosphatase domain-containing protein n=1 Tax=Eimeria tenella TaxID=5802 RepID=U6KI58_EIMTE|nr:hypothetical protein, conserved [Eimeria tenella]CDJ37720.1 hypothetical protein, conserved [Eimeria tenella]|eukprot:XP_013228558.1 hypothetical protein, conserved [Eimeria tenella]
MQRPYAARAGLKQLLGGPRALLTCVFFLLILPLEVTPFRYASPRVIGTGESSKSSLGFLGAERRRHAAATAGEYWTRPERASGQIEPRRTRSVGAFHSTSLPITVSPSAVRLRGSGNVAEEGDVQNSRESGPPSPCAEEEPFLHALLTQVLGLHLRMQDLLQSQQQQQRQQLQEQGPVAGGSPVAPSLHLYKKKDGSCVAAADIVAQVVILGVLSNRFPGDIFIAEETADLFSSLLPRRGPYRDDFAGVVEAQSEEGDRRFREAAAGAAQQLFRELGIAEKPLSHTVDEALLAGPSAAHTSDVGPRGVPIETKVLDAKESPFHLLREVVWLLSEGAPQHLISLLENGLRERSEAAANASTTAAAAGIAGPGVNRRHEDTTDTNGCEGLPGPFTVLFLRGLHRLLRRPEAYVAREAGDASPSARASSQVLPAAIGGTTSSQGLRCWLVDPIDGTRGFFAEQSGFCFSTAVALLVRREQLQQQQHQQHEPSAQGTQGTPRRSEKHNTEQEQQQQLQQPEVVLASICCPSYDLWNCSGSNGLLPFCTPHASRGPLHRPGKGNTGPAELSDAGLGAADATAGALAEYQSPGDSLSTVERVPPKLSLGTDGCGDPSKKVSQAVLCSEHLRGCVLTKAEGLPARLTVRDVRNGAFLHLSQLKQQQQQPEAGAFHLVRDDNITEWPWCKDPRHAREVPPSSVKDSRSTGGTPAAAASAYTNPFRWTASTPNYRQTHPLLQQHLSALSEPSGGPSAGSFLRQDQPTSADTPGPLQVRSTSPHSKGSRSPIGLTPKLGSPNLNLAPQTEATTLGTSREGPLWNTPFSGQQFLALRFGHIVKYLAVALGHADAFLLLPTHHASDALNSAPSGVGKQSSSPCNTHRASLEQAEFQALTKAEAESTSVKGSLEQTMAHGDETAPARPLLMVWDHAAGAAIVEMLGGVVLDSGWRRVQSYCYLPSDSAPTDVPSAASPVELQAPVHATGTLHLEAPPSSTFKAPSLASSQSSPPPVAFTLRGEALVAARSAEAAARALGALSALKA